MARTLREQLRDAWADSKLTLGDLLLLSGLEMDETSLGRKLSGQQSLRVEEAEALASALKIKISSGREARAS